MSRTLFIAGAVSRGSTVLLTGASLMTHYTRHYNNPSLSREELDAETRAARLEEALVEVQRRVEHARDHTGMERQYDAVLGCIHRALLTPTDEAGFALPISNEEQN